MLGLILGLPCFAVDPAPSNAVDWDRMHQHQRLFADVDNDGVVEEVQWGVRGGSGYASRWTCVTRTDPPATTCRHTETTAYSRFSATRLFALDGSGAPPWPVACAAADRTSPAQDSLWLLHGPRGVGTPRWRPGPPVAQVAVCMDVESARSLPGAFGWGSGDPWPGWTIVWTPATVLSAWAQSQQGSQPLPLQQAGDQGPVRVLSGEPEVWIQGHAIAIYSRQHDLHAWVANVEAFGNAGHKVARWPRIQRVERVDGGLRLTIRDHSAESTLDLGPQRGPSGGELAPSADQ